MRPRSTACSPWLSASRAGFVCALFFAAGVAQAGTLWVDWPLTPGGCGFEEMAAALRARLPGQQVQPGRHAVEPGHAQVAFSRDGADWRLEVSAPETPELRRTFADPNGDCLALDERAALVVDRYLEDIHWSGDPVTVEGFGPAPTTPTSRWRGVVEVVVSGGTGELSVPDAGTFGPSFELDVGAQKGPWRFELGVAADLPQRTSTLLPDGNTGSLNLQSGFAQVLVGRTLPVPGGDLFLGLAPGAQLYDASSTGDYVFHQKSSPLTAVPFVGARAAYELRLSRFFFLAARGSLRVPLFQETVEVQGYTGLSATTRPVAAEASLCFGSFFF